MARREHYVIIGAGDTPNKAVIAGKSKLTGGYEVAICQLDGGEKYQRGETVGIDDITGIYTTLHFCKKESLEAFIGCLNKVKDMWEVEND